MAYTTLTGVTHLCNRRRFTKQPGSKQRKKTVHQTGSPSARLGDHVKRNTMNILTRLFEARDPFSKVRSRVCSGCGQLASCYRIETTNGLSSFRFRCSACQREFQISSVFTVILTVIGGLFLVTLSPLLLFGPREGANQLLIAVGSGLVGWTCLGVAFFRTRTARRNPETSRPTR